jgi:hypothetical protein
MSTPPNFAPTLRLIQTINGLPRTGCSAPCGHTALTIQQRHNSEFPTTPLTLADVDTYLRAGVRHGVFHFGGCATGSQQTFFINTAMASLNPINQAYVNVGYMQNLDQDSPGYLACGSDAALGNPAGHPYGTSGPSRSGTFAFNPGFLNAPNNVACGAAPATSFN